MLAKVASGENVHAPDSGTVPPSDQLGLLGGRVGERKPEIKQRPKPSPALLKLIIELTRKKEIYKGNEIGYEAEAENQAQAGLLFLSRGEQVLR